MQFVVRRFFSDTTRRLIVNKKYRQARYMCQTELETLKEQNSLEALKQRISLLRNMSLCELNLGNYMAVEKCLQDCIDAIKAQPSSVFESKEQQIRMLNDNYEVLMLYLMKNNLTKTIDIGSVLINESTDDKFLTKINFYLGTSEILRENLTDAKDYLYDILNSKLPIIKLGMAFNNLGAACWWDLFPNYSPLTADEEMEEDEEEEYSERTHKLRKSDFSYAVDYFQTAIYKFEILIESMELLSEINAFSSHVYEVHDLDVRAASSLRIMRLLDLINNDYLTADEYLRFLDLMEKGELFKNPLSAVPLFNLAEMILSTTKSDQQRQQGLMYLHMAFRLLHKNLVFITNNTSDNISDPKITKLKDLYFDYSSIYRSLYIRCVTFLSLVSSLEKVALLVTKPRTSQKRHQLCQLQ